MGILSSTILSAVLANTLASSIASTAVTDNTAPPPVEAFARMPLMSDVSVSPNGSQLSTLYRAPGAKEYSFAVFDIRQGMSAIFASEQTEKFRINNPI